MTRTGTVRWLERLAWGAGALLLLVWGAARLHSVVGTRKELKRFEAARSVRTSPGEASPSSPETPVAATPGEPTPGVVDFTLWSPVRIEAYQASLRASGGAAAVAMLRIQSIGLEVPVLDGTDELTLNRAVGRIAGTARPGEPGNLGIAGHRDGFFRGLKDLARDSPLELETLDGRRLCYRVEDIRIVRPSAIEVLDPTPEPSLTLVTCYPFYFVGSAPERYIVRAVLVSAPAGP